MTSRIDVSSLGLPICSLLPQCLSILSANQPLLLTADPGAGKTTVLPLAILGEPWLEGKKILILEPRRLAAYAGATRMAALLGESVGETVGWRTGEETCVGPNTQIEVLTEGVLTRLLAADADLPGVAAVLFDEFHERTLVGDQGLAFCVDVRKNLRPDLRLGILSATLEVDAVRRLLPDGIEVHSPGRAFPVTTQYRPPRADEPWLEAVARAVTDGWRATRAGLLVFLPGWGEIQRVKALLEDQASAGGEVLCVLHGTLGAAQQSQVLEKSPVRRTVLASAVAQTSLTLPDVGLVIDAGFSRFVRFDPRNDLDRLVTERVSQADADQRRGRAGRTGPGECWRLWPAQEILELFPEPEIERSDLSGLVLDAVLWGCSKPQDLSWVSSPPATAWTASLSLLRRLEAIDGQLKPTATGREMGRLGVAPRLGHLLQKGRELNISSTAARVAAVLEERGDTPGNPDFGRRMATTNDRVERRYQTLLRRLGGPAKSDPDKVGLLLAAAFPEKVAVRQWGPEVSAQGPTSQYQTVGGRSLKLTGDLSRERWLAIAEADAGKGVGKVYSAAPLTEAEVATLVETSSELSWAVESVLAGPRLFRIRKWGALTIEKTGVSLKENQPAVVHAWCEAVLLLDGLAGLPWNEESRSWLGRVRLWVGVGSGEEWSDEALRAELATWAVEGFQWDGGMLLNAEGLATALRSRLGWALSQQLDQAVPRWVVLPSGNRRIEYPEDGQPFLRLKLQEAFGWKESPKVAGQRLILHLLSPAGRPLQITSDLAGFWTKSYLEVRKEMRGRYPRHSWPENPASDPV